MRRVFLPLAVLLFLCCALPAQDAGTCSQRLRGHVGFFASDSLSGRLAGTSGERRAADYIYDRLYEAGLTMLADRSGQDFSIVKGGDTLHSANIVGMVEGYDSALKGQYVVVGANMDHIGTNILTVDGGETIQVYPGANDNASGLSCLIELAERVAGTSFLFRRSVVFVAFGAKEEGMAGSWYFVNRAFSHTDSISVMVDLVSLGKSGESNPFIYYTCVPNPDVSGFVNRIAGAGSYYAPSHGEGTVLPNDYLTFYEKGIPVVLFTTGSSRTNRTVRDIPSGLDYQNMEYICEFVFNFIREAANADYMVSRISAEGEDPLDRVYTPYEVDNPPEFYHGDEKRFLERWVYTYLKYPEMPLSMGIQGQVLVEFIVEKDGSVSNVKAVRGDDYDLEDEAVRVVAASPKWKPATLGGEKVRVKYVIPVEFRLRKRK